MKHVQEDSGDMLKLAKKVSTLQVKWLAKTRYLNAVFRLQVISIWKTRKNTLDIASNEPEEPSSLRMEQVNCRYKKLSVCVASNYITLAMTMTMIVDMQAIKTSVRR